MEISMETARAAHARTWGNAQKALVRQMQDSLSISPAAKAEIARYAKDVGVTHSEPSLHENYYGKDA